MQPTATAIHANSVSLRERPVSFWEKVSVFPDDVDNRLAEYRHQAGTALTECGRGNLALLCQTMSLAFDAEAIVSDFVARLLGLPQTKELIHLAEFARGKDKAIGEEYELALNEGTRTGHSDDLDSLSHGSGEKLKVLTKLVLLYLNNPDAVESVFFRHWWRRLRTVASFVAEETLPSTAAATILAEASKLVNYLKPDTGSRELRFFGQVRLRGGPNVFMLHREYKPSTKPDYRDNFKTLHSFGAIVFGLNLDSGVLEVKSVGSRVIDSLRAWLSSKLGVKFKRRHGSPFSKYDPETCQKLLLGAYDESKGLKIIGIRIHRTNAPDHPPITLESPFAGPSLKEALGHLYSKELLRLRSLGDIDWIKFRFESPDKTQHFECQVEATVLVGGAVEISLDDSGIREDHRDCFAQAFQATFQLPLYRPIDPKPVGLGKAAIYRALLDTDLKRDVHAYQQECLSDLVKLGITSEQIERIRQCRTPICESRGVPVHDQGIERCPRCRQELKLGGVRKLIHDESRMFTLGGGILQKATGWTFGRQPIQFEKNSFYPLRNPQRPEEMVCVFFHKRVNQAKIELFDRSAFPVLVVHTSGEYEYAHLDIAGVAHLGFAYAIAADNDRASFASFKQDCERALRDLRERTQARTVRAAHQSRTTLKKLPEGYGGTAYESDIFNLLHGIFPYVMKWGGKNSPDGFCSLLFYEENDLSKVTKFNWSYDTKFSESDDGYDFGMAEKRQMFDYVTALFKQKRLQTQGDRLDAHVIISNNLDSGKMKDAAQVLRRKHRLGQKHPNLKLVLMMEGFITTLHDKVHSKSGDFRRRWPYLSERLAHLLQQENDDGYVHLTGQEAEELVAWVLKQKEIEEPVDQQELRETLKETMSGD
jgi:hypothetical protein